MIYDIEKYNDDKYICFLHFDYIKAISIFFDNASLSRDKECVNLFSEHIKVASLPISWEEFKYLRDSDMPLSVEVFGD